MLGLHTRTSFIFAKHPQMNFSHPSLIMIFIFQLFSLGFLFFAVLPVPLLLISQILWLLVGCQVLFFSICGLDKSVELLMSEVVQQKFKYHIPKAKQKSNFFLIGKSFSGFLCWFREVSYNYLVRPLPFWKTFV